MGQNHTHNQPPSWKISSHCANGSCVQVKIGDDTMWKRSSKCSGGTCVETDTTTYRRVLVRNSKFPLDEIEFTFDEWDAFIRGVKDGEFDLPEGWNS